MPIFAIENPEDARLAPYRAVSDPELARSAGLFLAEGRLVVGRLLAHPTLATRSVLVTPAALQALGPLLAARPAVPVFAVAQDVMNTVTGFNIHRGCLALGERPARRSWSEVVTAGATPDRLVVLERVGNADNVGSIFRSAAALGAGAVLLSEGCADPLYRKAIRTSMGASLVVPFADAEPWPAMLDGLRAIGVTTVAMTPDASARPLDDVAAMLGSVRLKPDTTYERTPDTTDRSTAAFRPAAIVLGHEGDGLSAAALARCDYRARIDIAPEVDSLNVGTAAAIALYALRCGR